MNEKRVKTESLLSSELESASSFEVTSNKTKKSLAGSLANRI
jgi:hypothetical protein